MKKRLCPCFSFFIFFLLFSVSLNTNAQIYSAKDGWSIGIAGGATKFHGDLSDKGSSFINGTPFSSFFYTERRFAGSFYVEKMISPYFGVRGILLNGTVMSSQKSVNQYFEADYFDYTLSLTLDFTNIILGPKRSRDYRVFGFVGMGLSHSRTVKYDMTTNAIIGGNGSKNKMIETVGPVGLGISFLSSQMFSFNFESSLHIVHTNKLDGTPVGSTSFEKVGYISFGVVYNFNRGDGHGRNSNSYEGRSDEQALKEFNKRKRVVMRTNQNRKSFKKRYRRKRKRR